MGITLVSDIKNDQVLGCLENTVQRYCQFYYAQIGCQMAASLCNMIQQKLASLAAQLLYFLGRQLFYVIWLMGSGPAIAHSFTSHPFSVSRYRCMGYKKAHGYSDHHTSDHLQRGMSHHLLQMHILQKGGIFLADIDPLADQLIQHLGLLTSLMPHPHCIVHRNDRHNAGHRKNGRLHANAASRSNDHRTDRGAVGTGHAAVSPHPLQLEFTQQDEIDDRFEHLSREPAQQGYGQDLR